MNVVNTYKHQQSYGTNKIIIIDGENDDDLLLKNSKIVFKGNGNVIILEKNSILINSTFLFEGDNSLVYIKKTRNPINIYASIFSNNCLFIDKGASFNGALSMSLSERENILIGKDCMFSFGIWIRTSDVHLIYNLDGKRINDSKGVMIGDHVWIGQDVFLPKVATIGSGSVVGAKSVVSGVLSSNGLFAGVPSKQIKEDIFWDRPSTHNYSKEETIISQNFTKDLGEYNFVKDTQPNHKDKVELYNRIKDVGSIKEKIDIIDIYLSGSSPLVIIKEDKPPVKKDLDFLKNNSYS